MVPSNCNRAVVSLVAAMAVLATVAPALAAPVADPGPPRIDEPSPARPVVPDGAVATGDGDAHRGLDRRGIRSAGPGGQSTGVDPGLANVTTHDVTLVTGQTVHVVETGNHTFYRVDGDGPVNRVRTPQGTYVYPAGVDFDTYDRALFNVDLLIAQGLTDAEAGSVPVVVQVNRSARGGVARQSVGRGLDGFRTERRLESIGAVAGRVDRDGLGSDGRVDAFGAGDAPRVEAVYLDRQYQVTLNDSTAAVHAGQARRTLNVSGRGVRVAVLDSGVDDEHPDLDEGTVVAEKDFSGEGTADDQLGHGTHVAAIIAGDGDASNGTHRGVAPNASIVNVRVLGPGGRGRTSDIVAGMEYAVAHDADVLSISLGGRASGDTPLATAAQRAVDHGATVVIAAGNSGPVARTIASPGIAPGAITVGASDGDESIARFSSRGPTPIDGRLKPDVVAPGVGVVSACTDGTYETCDGPYVAKDGTSMATPHVSGVAALMLQRHPDWSPGRVKAALLSTAEPLDANATVYDQGAGLVDASRAVEPGVVVRNATMSLGTLTGKETVTRTITVENRGDRSRTLDVETTVYGVEDGPTSAAVETNRSRLTLSPGETGAVRLVVQAKGRRGVYGGRVTFDGERRNYTAVFGYRLADEVVVEKESIGATTVEGDTVWVYPRGGYASVMSLEVEDGRVSFASTDDGGYALYSTGIQEGTGRPVVVSTSVDDTRRVVLDESETELYRIDRSELRSVHGSTTTLSLQAGVSTSAYGEAVEVLTDDPETPAARFGTETSDGAVLEALVVPGDRDDAPAPMDVPVAYHLVYATGAVDGPETFEVDRSRLARDERTYHRSSAGVEYELSQYATVFGGSASRTDDAAFEWDLDGRTEQTTFVTPETVRYYDILRYGDTPNDTVDDVVARDRRTLIGVYSPEVGERDRTAFGRAPYTPSAQWAYFYGSELHVGVDFQRDQPPRRAYYHDPGVTSEIAVRIDGETVYENATTSYYDDYRHSDSLDAGSHVDVEVETGTDRSLSSRVVAEYRVEYDPDGDSRPPSIDWLLVDGLDASNAAPGGRQTVTLNFTDESGVEDVTVLYATDPGVPVPFENGSVVRTDGWKRAGVSRVGDDRFAARLDAPASADAASVAVLAEDGANNSVATTVFEAFYVGDRGKGTPLAPYTNASGYVTTAGLQSAVSDWVTEEISTATLQRVVAAWVRAEPVA